MANQVQILNLDRVPRHSIFRWVAYRLPRPLVWWCGYRILNSAAQLEGRIFGHGAVTEAAEAMNMKGALNRWAHGLGDDPALRQTRNRIADKKGGR